jgi:hypothetical protein
LKKIKSVNSFFINTDNSNVVTQENYSSSDIQTVRTNHVFYSNDSHFIQ